MSEANGLDDVYHVTRDEEYERQLQAEAEYWGRPQPFSVLDLDMPDVLDAYFNEQLVGDRRAPWWETIPRYGLFRRGCVLGLGALKREARILELCPSLHLTIFDISSGALARREQELGARFPGRVTTATADLNFIELAPGSYDLMVSDGCLHHVLNLEHVAFQVDRALTPDGYFFLRDYVGESRFQFSAAKKGRLEGTLRQMRARHPVLRYWGPAWPNAQPWDQYSPFEAVRSEETLGILGRYLNEVSLRAAAPLILFLWLRPFDDPVPVPRLDLFRRLLRSAARLAGRDAAVPTRDLRELMRLVGRDLIAFDRRASASGLLLPNWAFGVYQKRRGDVS